MPTKTFDSSPGYLKPEFEHMPVPDSHRKSLLSVIGVWFGFPMVLSNAVFGGVIVASLGFPLGLVAILLGNFVLALYVGAISYRAGSTGLNFALIAQKTFGKKGYAVVSGLLATVVVGWYAFQVGLTGATMHTSFGSNELLMNLIAGLLYMALTYVGIRALTIIGWIAAPLYIVMGVSGILLAIHHQSLVQILSYRPPRHLAGSVSFGVALTMVVAGFSDSGTMTPDFTRWAKNGGHGILAALSAFPLANMISMVVGGLVVAAGAIANPITNGGNFMMVLAGHGVLLEVLSIFFIFANLGSVCSHCLYNGAVGWSHITGSTMRKLTVILGIIGIIAAVAGIWNIFVTWLSFLGFVVPGIGAVIIVDQLIFPPSPDIPFKAWRPKAFIAWALGSSAALWTQLSAPQYSEAVVGLAVAASVYFVMMLFDRQRVPIFRSRAVLRE
ncbi:MAG: cytosine permease [Firmicutes bacterium]|nr:cytosine permease [Bacillota bacterium]